MYLNELNQDEKVELAAMNAAVKQAIAARREWLDAKVAEHARIKPGEDLYDLDTGQKVGVVTSLYRYWRDHEDGVRDTSFSAELEFRTRPCCSDNTSRQPSRFFGSKEDVIRNAEIKLARARRL